MAAVSLVTIRNGRVVAGCYYIVLENGAKMTVEHNGGDAVHVRRSKGKVHQSISLARAEAAALVELLTNVVKEERT